jgi:VanZ family protein
LDHFLGYFAATSIVWLAWPRRPFLVGGFMMGTAALLEALQTFTPDRHADFYAALFGAGGALTQALLAELFIRVRRRAKTWIKIKNPKAPAATRAADGTF